MEDKRPHSHDKVVNALRKVWKRRRDTRDRGKEARGMPLATTQLGVRTNSSMVRLRQTQGLLLDKAIPARARGRPG
jgi:hypothetical protein